MNSWYHAKSSVKKWSGVESDYLPIHEFIDSSKKIIGDSRHRSIYHHTEGCWLAQQIFGRTITVGRGIQVPVREIAERHIIEDLGWLPSPSDYIKNMNLATWMSGSIRKEVPLSHLLSGKSIKEANGFEQR